VEAGAEIINDISALNADKKMAWTAAQTKAALVLMHMRGNPANMQKGHLGYDDLMGEITDYLRDIFNISHTTIQVEMVESTGCSSCNSILVFHR